MKLSVALLFPALFAAAMAHAEEPWSVFPEHPVTAEVEHHTEEAHAQLSGYTGSFFRFFRDYISGFDGSNCYYLPTCSYYTGKAVEEYGFFRGAIMGADRLIRCHEGQKERPFDPPVHY